MALSISSNNIPTMFRYLELLATLPDTSTHEMLFNSATIEQVAEDAANNFRAEFGYEGDMEEDILGDPDALDKAKYQAENPNAIMTPWGPALDPEAVDAIIDGSPGVQELLGLTNEEISEVTALADAIIDDSGDNLDAIVDQSELIGMDENLDPKEVGIGMLNEMASQPSPDQDLSLLDRLMGLNIAEGYGDGPIEEQDTTAEQDIDDEGDDVALADRQFLDSLLDLTDSQILSVIDEALKDWLPTESVTSWVQGYPEWSYEVSTRYNLGQGVLALVSGEDYEDWLEGPPDIETPEVTTEPIPSTPEPQYALDTASWSTLMGIEFLEALNKQPHPRYEGYTMGGLLTRKQKLDRYNEAYVVFFLDRESVEGEAPTIAKEFAAFLNKYWNNPEAHSEYMDKAKLIEKAQLLASYFDDPTGMQIGEKDVGDIYAAYAETIFGDIYGEGPTFNDDNREILLKLIRSGRGYGDHPANRYVSSKLTSDKTWGKLWQVSFREMVENMPQPVAKQPEDGTGEYFTFEGYPLDEGAEGVSGTMLGYGPEYYGTGNPFGMPGVTLGMLRPEPVERMAQMVPGDAPDPQDPRASLGQEFYGVGYPFGGGNILSDGTSLDETTTNWGMTKYGEVDPTMVIPNINAAALPVSKVDPEQLAAYKAAQADKDVAYWATHWGATGGAPPSFIDPAVVAAITQYSTLDNTTPIPLVPYSAPAGISWKEHMDSMPTPFNETEAERLYKGLSYKTGHSTKHTAHKWSTMSTEEKAAIIGGDSWVEGTRHVPMKSWTPDAVDPTARMLSGSG